MAQPIYLDPELQSLEREKQLALALQQRGMKPVEGQMVGNRYVAPAWTQNLANLYDVYSGAQRVTEAEKKIASEQARQQSLAQENLMNAMKVAQGTAGTPDIIPQGQTLRDDEGNLTYGAKVGTGTVAPDKQKAIAMLLRPNATAVEQTMATKLLEKQFQEPKWEKSVQYLPNGQEVHGYVDLNSPNPNATFTAGSTKPAMSYKDMLEGRYNGWYTGPIPVAMGGSVQAGITGGGATQPSPTAQAGGVQVSPETNQKVTALGGNVNEVNMSLMPKGLSPKQQQEWIAKQAEPLPEGAQKVVTGSINLQKAVDDYRKVLANFSTMDFFNPNKRLEMNNAYRDMQLQAKEAYNLGVLNGKDLEVLESIVKNPTDFSSLLNTRKALDSQAVSLRNRMAGTIESAYQSHGKAVPKNILGNTNRVTQEQPQKVVETPAQMPTFASQADAEAAAKAGKIKNGDRVVVNGQSGTWRN